MLVIGGSWKALQINIGVSRPETVVIEIRELGSGDTNCQTFHLKACSYVDDWRLLGSVAEKSRGMKVRSCGDCSKI